MPTNSILEDVLAGNFSEKNNPNLPKKDILKHLFNDLLLLLCKREHTFLRKGLNNQKCFSSDDINPKIKKYLQDNLDNGRLKNLINFLAQKIEENQSLKEETKNLMSFVQHYSAIYDEKIQLPNSKFAKIDIQTTISFINFLTRLFIQLNLEKFDEWYEFETPAFKTLEHSESLIYNINSNYTKEDLLELLKNLGNLGFKIRYLLQDLSLKIQEVANKTIHSSNFNSTEAKELAGYTFLSEFHAGSTSEIESDCQNFLALEKCPKPITANYQLFQKIIQGNYTNQKPPFSDFEQVKNEIKQNFNSLDHPSQFHSFTFLKNILKSNSKSEFDFELLYKFVSIGLDKLKKDLEQQNNLDHSFTQATESLSFFLFNIVKINANNQKLHSQIHIIKEFSQFYKKIINHAPQLNSLLNTLYKHLFNILDRNIDSELALQTGFHEFLTIIKDLNKVCRETGNCGNLKIKILARSFKSLGSISRKSSGYNLSITNEAQKLIKLTGSNLNSNQLIDAISYFFKANINGRDIYEKCKQIFNISGCRPSINITLDDSITEIEEIISTLPPEKYLKEINISSKVSTPITSTSTIPANSTKASVIITKELPHYSNSTDLNSNKESILSLPPKLGTTIGLGAFVGFLNGGSQIILNIAEQKNCSLNTQRLLAVTLAIANSFAISTLPLIYSIVENLANEETDSLVNSQKLLTCTYAFITSMVLQSIHAGTHYVLPKKSILKKLFNMLPLFAGLWMLANSEEGAIESFAILGTHILTSMAASSLTYFSLNRLVSAKNQQASVEYYVKYEAGECAFEKEPLKEKATNSNNITNGTQKDSSPVEVFFEKVQFTTSKQFINLKQYLNNIIKDVEELQDKLSDQEHSNRLEHILNIPEDKQGLRYDLMDLEAFPQKFEAEYNKCINKEQKSDVLRNNLDYFKTMIKTIYDKLLSDNVNDDCIKDILCSIETKTLKENINGIIKSIKDNLGFIRGITKPIVSIHLPQKNNVTRFSIASSSGNSSDSAHSDGYDNSKYNAIEVLEEQNLLQTRLNR